MQQTLSKAEFFERYRDDKDKYGFNLEFYKDWEGFVRFFYETWFDVTMIGLENIPSEGRAVLCGNHSGGLPLDGFMLYDGIINYHPSPRRLRILVAEVVRTLPIAGDMIRAFGGIPAKYDAAIDLLNNDELVLFYPEAEKGTGKLYRDRYHLVDFNPGFVKAAIQTGSKIVPITTVGGDEVYPMLANVKPLAKLLGAPYWPITPFFPWLPFPFNIMPLPIKLLICVGRPFKLDYPPEKAEDHQFITGIAREVQNNIQNELNDLLKLRRSPFHKWDVEKVEAYHKHYM